MGELDYQMALLLQHRFEQEYKSKKSEEKSDYELARFLQEQFEQEEVTNKPVNNLVYDQPKSQLNSSKCLTDPSWELVDPTPDIHALFMAFNQRFFWNKLLSVCVSWSKRMTSCAGICSYNGRGGMCSITLSEPLLKLRPRKDLVETLLHEMIHAYLFVTHNNKDRDGHGPEFHKHMYRINKESGTNITVYHSFHDEVRLYQQHWWRCNGPCQHWKPYFGMVRRASNRAPGPNDKWWGEHSRNCGGIFIKVKEPEKPVKKKSDTKNESKVKNGDIRSFLPNVKSGETSSSNVKSFKDLTDKVKGKYNSNSTIVVTKNTNMKNNTGSTFQPTVFNKDREKTETSRSSEVTNDFLTVRDHWANKFNNTSSKRPIPLEQETKPNKVPKNSPSGCVSSSDEAECPNCSRKVTMTDINNHLDSCLDGDRNRDSNDFIDLTSTETVDVEKVKECPICNKNISSSSFDCHVETCLMKIYDNVEEQISGRDEKDKVPCLACGKIIIKDNLNAHLDDCMIDIFDTDMDKNDDENKKDTSIFNCPFCMKLFGEEEMKKHIDECLNNEDGAIMESLTDCDF